MKVLLVGAYGQLGTEFRKFFESKGIEYIPVSKNKRDEKTLVADISSMSSISKVFDISRFDVIINCSAYNYVDKAETEGMNEAFSTNVIGVGNLAWISRIMGIPIIHYSTDYVFDGEKKSPYVEEDITNPLSKYGFTKLLGEKLLSEVWNKFICIRVSWVFGRGGETNFIRKLLEWSKKGSVKVSTDEVSSPTPTDVIVKVSWKLLEEQAFGLYHLSSEGECSRYEYAKFILDTLKWNGEISETTQSYFNLPAKRPKYSKLDPSKVKKITKIEIPHWKDSVYKYLKEEYNI